MPRVEIDPKWKRQTMSTLVQRKASLPLQLQSIQQITAPQQNQQSCNEFTDGVQSLFQKNMKLRRNSIGCNVSQMETQPTFTRPDTLIQRSSVTSVHNKGLNLQTSTVRQDRCELIHGFSNFKKQASYRRIDPLHCTQVDKMYKTNQSSVQINARSMFITSFG